MRVFLGAQGTTRCYFEVFQSSSWELRQRWCTAHLMQQKWTVTAARQEVWFSLAISAHEFKVKEPQINESVLMFFNLKIFNCMSTKFPTTKLKNNRFFICKLHKNGISVGQINWNQCRWLQGRGGENWNSLKDAPQLKVFYYFGEFSVVWTQVRQKGVKYSSGA